ncbi:thioredoxin [Sunxiuqinia dokdonensis]|uniref:Thioredoxin n=1 Tax=Sunxiuqinia dokdonensis TaxID=1409788 RepID=A0A0L8V8E0_9BACT|nr:thioredoxin [Sunxiuqinia dokdonensis]KOH44740.1 thioredoxin [Sunxiuqinia dokdonensis]
MEKFKQIVQGATPVLVDFSAEWCGPCKMMAPILKQLKEQMGDGIRILKIDVDRNQELANQYQIRSVPTLMLFQHGERKWTGSGVMQADQLASVIQQTTKLV